MEIINNLLALDWLEILQAVLAIFGGAAVIAKYTKTPKDDNAIGKVLKYLRIVIDFLAQNGRNAENKHK